MPDEKTSEETPEESSENQTEETEENPEEKTPVKKSNKLKSALAQKDHWKKKYEELKNAKEDKSDEKETPIKPSGEETPKTQLSSEDVLVLVNSKITHPDDIKEIKDYASYKKISVEEALKSSVVQNTLQTNREQRKTADATNTGTGRRGTGKTSVKDLMRKRQATGELPESDEEIEKLAAAEVEEKYKSE